MAPPFALGHGAQCVLGKVVPSADGRIRLELTADYGENPMIDAIEDARKSLKDLVQWRPVSDKEGEFQSLSTPSFETRTQLDPSIPLPMDDDQREASHQLVAAIWEWTVDAQAVEFRVRFGTALDVLLWTDSTDHLSEAAESGVRWAVLIAGDVSPAVALPVEDAQATNGFGRWAWWSVLGSGVLALVAVRRFRKKK